MSPACAGQLTGVTLIAITKEFKAQIFSPLTYQATREGPLQGQFGVHVEGKNIMVLVFRIYSLSHKNIQSNRAFPYVTEAPRLCGSMKNPQIDTQMKDLQL